MFWYWYRPQTSIYQSSNAISLQSSSPRRSSTARSCYCHHFHRRSHRATSWSPRTTYILISVGDRAAPQVPNAGPEPASCHDSLCKLCAECPSAPASSAVSQTSSCVCRGLVWVPPYSHCTKEWGRACIIIWQFSVLCWCWSSLALKC